MNMEKQQWFGAPRNLMIMTNQREIEITQFVSGCMRMKGCATGALKEFNVSMLRTLLFVPFS